MTETSNWLNPMPDQEAYGIDRLLHRIQHDRNEEKAFFADPQAYIAKVEVLSERAADALARTDVGELYLLGANPYLLRAYCLQLRMPEDEYLSALQAVAGKEEM